MEWMAEKYDSFQKRHQFQYGSDLISRLELYTSLAGNHILDLGCGNGELTLILKSKTGDSGKVTAVDPEGGMLDTLRTKAGSKEIDIYQSDALNWLTSTNQKYDIIFSNAVLHWLNSYKEFEEVVRGVHRCLCKTGYLATRFSLYRNAEAAKVFLEEQLKSYTGNRDLALRRSVFEFEPCIACFERQGFRMVTSEELEYMPFSEPEMSFHWMVSSQPLLTYLSADKLPDFEQFLWEHWQQEPVEVRSHHGLFIAQKTDRNS